MNQHPVPQNISSYEFRLVGDMTLKQFFQLAGGVGFGLLFTRMPLPFFLKWPLAGICVLVGIMMAFVPVNGRPFSQWILAFIKAVYSPTEFSWQSTLAQPLEAPPTPVVASGTKSHSPLDLLESQIFSRVSSLFSGTPTPAVTVASTTPAQSPAPQVLPPSAAASPVTSTSVMEAKKPIMVAEVVGKPETAAPPPPTPISPAPAAAKPIYQSIPTPAVTPMVPHSPSPAGQPAILATQLTPPERPNILVGQIVSATGQGLEGAIVEVADATTGIPVRALKSNKVGQFQSATPLNNGQYTVILEKEGYTFTPVAITATGAIINPILVTAQG